MDFSSINIADTAWAAIHGRLARLGRGVVPTVVRCTAEPVGFNWHAPLYQRPHPWKDHSLMQDSPVADDTTPQSQEDVFRWRRHPVLRKPLLALPVADEEPVACRQARLAAVRGVQAARDGRIDDASRWFAEAVADPSIRLQDVPGFWDCTRGGMQAAVDAYEAAQRFRDASTLAAIIRTRYRPRALAPLRTRAVADVLPGDRATSTGD